MYQSYFFLPFLPLLMTFPPILAFPGFDKLPRHLTPAIGSRENLYQSLSRLGKATMHITLKRDYIQNGTHHSGIWGCQEGLKPKFQSLCSKNEAARRKPLPHHKMTNFLLTLNIPAYLPPYSYRQWTNLTTNCIWTMSALTKKNVKQTFLLLVIQSIFYFCTLFLSTLKVPLKYL